MSHSVSVFPIEMVHNDFKPGYINDIKVKETVQDIKLHFTDELENLQIV